MAPPADPLSNNTNQRFIVALAVPSVSQLDPLQIERATYGADVIELRVDHLSLGTTSIPPVEYVLSQVRLLKKITRLPVLFTIRTASQGGKFPDNETEKARDLLLAAIDTGCEYIDVEITWPEALVSEILSQKKNTRVVASFHDWTGTLTWTQSCLEKSYNQALQFGDIVKLSILHTKETDNYEMLLFVRDHQQRSNKPILAVGMGLQGQLSRVLAPISIVTHPLLPIPTAPGQLSINNINQVKHLIGRIKPRKFFILGNHISHSLSPTIHNAAFAELGLPHHYSIHQTPQLDDSVKAILQSPQFGGSSVTLPHKLNIQPFLHSISDIALIIGAVSTIAVREEEEEDLGGQINKKRVLFGDNTDWIGIRSCIQQSALSPEHLLNNPSLVLGAGGAARAAIYALEQLGSRHIILVNRTKERAESAASSFPNLKFSIYQSLQEVSSSVNCIVACIPADDIKEEDFPKTIFGEEGAGVIVEMAYRPKITALMEVGRRLKSWSVFSGLDVLKGQAYGQFELWTGIKAPVLAIADALSAHEDRI